MRELTASGLTLLAELERDGMAESFHHGVAALVDPDGKTVCAFGDHEALIYPRSALKPLQALAMNRLGLRLAPKETVMTMASHYGTPEQVGLVAKILTDHGLTQNQLGCPSDLPWNQEARIGAQRLPINMNCSGKHAGFLATCQLNGWDVAGYLDTEHPVQLAAKNLTEQLSGEIIDKVTLDGCGAPLFAISTGGLARAISGFVQLAPELAAAGLSNPRLIGDRSTPDAAFLEAGFFSKLGAEGVFTVATTSGFALAIKIADGSLRAAPEIAIEMLRQQGLIAPEQIEQIRALTAVAVLGAGKSVGGLRVKI